MAASTAPVSNLPGSSQTAGDKIPQHVAITDTSGNVIETFGAGGGTQYTEGDTDTTITGTAVVFEADTSTSTLRAVSATYPLPVEEIGADTFAANQVSVTTAATLIVAARAGRRSVGIVNHGTTAVYLGPANTVTTSNGLLLTGTAGASVVLDYSGNVYGIVGAGSQTVSYGEEY
jgi:hypothetical protein